MRGIHLHFDYWALLLLIASSVPAYMLYRWGRRFAEPSIYYPDLTQISSKVPLAALSRYLTLIALALFSMAFLDPRLYLKKSTIGGAEPPRLPPKEGIAIYLVLDQSGSMQEKVFANSVLDGYRKEVQISKKIDLVKLVTKQFIEGNVSKGLQGRPNDLIGLIYFARGAHVVSPLTMDHRAILSSLEKFDAINDKEQDGTSIGYAIYKAANLMAATRHYSQELIAKGEAAYTIKSNVIILLTDGLQDPNPLDKGKRLRNIDIPEAAAYAKEEGIKLYIVNVEPKLSDAKYAPNRNIMQRAAESTGGKFYMVDENADLNVIYREIDKLEKSELPAVSDFAFELNSERFHQYIFYPYLTALAMALIFVSFLLDTTYLRRVP